jgi:hypothetical protein
VDRSIPDLNPPLVEELKRTLKHMQSREWESQAKATLSLVLPPNNERLLNQTNSQLHEDDPEVHAQLRAQTRDIRPGLSLICLHASPDGKVFLEPELDGQTIDLTAVPDWAQIQDLLQRGVTVRHWKVMQSFLSQEVPKGWREEASLRACRPAIFTEGACQVTDTDYELVLDRELGLFVRKEGV